jgi:hypothetical protein
MPAIRGIAAAGARLLFGPELPNRNQRAFIRLAAIRQRLRDNEPATLSIVDKNLGV